MRRRTLLQRTGAVVAAAALAPLAALAPRPYATGGIVRAPGRIVGASDWNRFYDATPWHEVPHVTPRGVKYITITARVENMDALRETIARLNEFPL